MTRHEALRQAHAAMRRHHVPEDYFPVYQGIVNGLMEEAPKWFRAVPEAEQFDRIARAVAVLVNIRTA